MLAVATVGFIGSLETLRGVWIGDSEDAAAAADDDRLMMDVLMLHSSTERI